MSHPSSLMTVDQINNLLDIAHQEGMKAGQDVTPTPMHLMGGVPGQPKKHFVVNEGACGFARIIIKPGTSRLARCAKKHMDARKAWDGGVYIWVHQFGQSVARKEAYARAFRDVLRNAGFDRVYADSRLD